MTNPIKFYPGDVIQEKDNDGKLTSYFVFKIIKNVGVKCYDLGTGVSKIFLEFNENINLIYSGKFHLSNYNSYVCKICPVKKLLGECNSFCKYLDRNENSYVLRDNIMNVGLSLRLNGMIISKTLEIYKAFFYKFELHIDSIYILGGDLTEEFFDRFGISLDFKEISNLSFDLSYTKDTGEKLRIIKKDELYNKIVKDNIKDQIRYLCDGCILLDNCKNCSIYDLRRSLQKL